MLQKSFLKGYLYAKLQSKKQMAEDAPKWITVKPNDGKGRKALIDGETGIILGGMGGKFTGQHIKNANKEAQSKIKEKLSKPIEVNTPPTTQPKKANTAQIDLSLPNKIDKSLILQNRNRSTVASIKQMQSIASNPDYYRMSVSRSLNDGAPVVSYGSFKDESLGNKSKIVASDGTRYDVQYAVVEADSVLTSNNAMGITNEAYYSDDPSKSRAIAGNGRLAGMQEAYRKGTANEYKAELMDDTVSHGVSAETIAKMKNPVLIRIMQPKDVTADIGDKSNTATNSTMTSVEQANNDTSRIQSIDKVKTYWNGTPHPDAVRDFISQMPQSERASLVDADGEPTKKAMERMQNALIAKAYENDDLSHEIMESWSPESLTITNALRQSAPALASLKGLPDGYDVRDIVSKASVRAFKELKRGKSLDEAQGNVDMFESADNDSASRAILKMFANTKNSKDISQKLIKMADTLKAYAEEEKSPMGDLFGGSEFAFEKPKREDIIKKALASDSALHKMSALKYEFWKSAGGNFLQALFDGVALDYKYNFFDKLRSITSGSSQV